MVTSRKPSIKSIHSGLMMNTAQVQLLWERHKVWKKICHSFFKTKWRIFIKFLWPSQNIWSLVSRVKKTKWKIFFKFLWPSQNIWNLRQDIFKDGKKIEICTYLNTLESRIDIGPTVILFSKFSMPYVYSRPYIYSFCQIFQALRLFPALRLLGTLE